jgi:hypothetical protein
MSSFVFVATAARAAELTVRNYVQLRLRLFIDGEPKGVIAAAPNKRTPTVERIQFTMGGAKVKVVAIVAPGQLFAGQEWNAKLGASDLNFDVRPFQSHESTGVPDRPTGPKVLTIRNHVELNLDISIDGRPVGSVGAAPNNRTPNVGKIKFNLTGRQVTVKAMVAPGQAFSRTKWTRVLDASDLTLDVIPFQNDK